MGVPRLTRHLLPLAQSILVGSPTGRSAEHVDSIVIDGPSLVYHVYYRLLSWMPWVPDSLDVQPTCTEVSLGVVVFLLQIASLGVKM